MCINLSLAPNPFAKGDLVQGSMLPGQVHKECELKGVCYAATIRASKVVATVLKPQLASYGRQWHPPKFLESLQRPKEMPRWV